jgi:hypothetical protein
LCSAVAYCCGAVAPRAIAALLGRFLPRLGPLANASGPFFFFPFLFPFFGPSFFPAFPDLSFFLRSLSCRFHAKPRLGIFKSWNIQELEFSRSGISKSRVPSRATARGSIPRKGSVPRSIRRRPGTARDRRTARWPAPRPALRNPRPPARIWVRVRASVRPCRSLG